MKQVELKQKEEGSRLIINTGHGAVLYRMAVKQVSGRVCAHAQPYVSQ